MAERLHAQTLAQFFIACSMKKWQKNWAGPENDANIMDAVDGKCIWSLHPTCNPIRRVSPLTIDTVINLEREKDGLQIYLLGGCGGWGGP